METRTNREMNKLLVLVLSLLVMVCMLPVSAFADNNGTITASGIEKGATVKAYQIVKQKADGDWEAVVENSIADPTKPTAAEITALASNTSGLTAIDMEEGTVETTSDGVAVVDYTKAGLEAGMYLVLVEKADSDFVYNPMIISVNYDNDGKLDGGSVNADSQFTVGDETAYAKRTKPSVDKKITGKVENDNVTGDSTTQGDTLKEGDEVSFEITTTIPAYSAAYDNEHLMFEISDTVSAGLDDPTNIVVSDANGPLTEGNEYTLEQTGKTFKIAFSKSYLLSDSAKSITVTYKSKLNADATSGFDANTNKATIEYSNTPTTTEDKDKTTYHYTFDIDGNVFGSMTGKEIVKVGVDATTGELITAESSSTTTTTPLQGAKFGLYKVGDDAEAVAEVLTDVNGLMTFKRLDAGEYYLKELQAPAGYKTDSTQVPVSIKAELNTDGTLKSYSITINGENTTTYTANNSGPETTVDMTGDTSLFNNYKAGALPSTGGSGIYFYIAAGLILIGLAIVVYVYNRRREARDN